MPPLSPPLLGKKKKKIILVVGVTGSGKSTCASQLSEILNIPHIELDGLYWDANWTPSPHFEERVTNVLEQDDEYLILDGNYRNVMSILWEQHVETVIWLDYPFWTVFWRLLCRCIYRWWYQIPLGLCPQQWIPKTTDLELKTLISPQSEVFSGHYHNLFASNKGKFQLHQRAFKGLKLASGK